MLSGGMIAWSDVWGGQHECVGVRVDDGVCVQWLLTKPPTKGV